MQRLRAGIIPTWATQTSETNGGSMSLNVVGKPASDVSKLKYTGMTGDASALVVDTSSGLRPTELLVLDAGEEERVEWRDAGRV